MEVTTHVFCRIGENGDSNNGFILCDQCCIVVDTATFPFQTEKDLQNIEKTTDKKIKFLINTHYHPDHTFGNMYFSDIIAHQNCHAILKEEAPSYMKEIEEDRERFQGFTINLPNILFRKELTLSYAPEIVITHHGGHTPGSATVLIPEEKVLFAGDLIFEGSHPYLGDANILEWGAVLQKIKELDVTKIVPGHGNVCNKSEINRHINYLTTFYNALKDLKNSYTKEELCKNTELLNLPELDKKVRIARNIEAQYDKISE